MSKKKLAKISSKRSSSNGSMKNSNIVQRLKKLKATYKKVKKKLKFGKDVHNDEELEALLEDKHLIQTFTDNYLQETQEAKQQLADIEERHKEIIKIEEHLTEVRDLFMQVAILVEQQQESINRVEYHANAAADYVEEGAVDLGKSARSKRKYNKRKTYIIIALCIIIIVIVVMLFL